MDHHLPLLLAGGAIMTKYRQFCYLMSMGYLPEYLMCLLNLTASQLAQYEASLDAEHDAMSQ